MRTEAALASGWGGFLCASGEKSSGVQRLTALARQISLIPKRFRFAIKNLDYTLPVATLNQNPVLQKGCRCDLSAFVCGAWAYFFRLLYPKRP
jgi:hypothetical protein